MRKEFIVICENCVFIKVRIKDQSLFICGLKSEKYLHVWTSQDFWSQHHT